MYGSIRASPHHHYEDDEALRKETRRSCTHNGPLTASACLLLIYIAFVGTQILRNSQETLELLNSDRQQDATTMWAGGKPTIFEMANPRSESFSQHAIHSISENNNKHEEKLARILIVYGPAIDPYQELMAKHVAQGATSAQTHVVIGTVENTTFHEVLQSDAIIIGASVENANPHHEVQQWINERWDLEANLQNKVGAAFVTAGGISAGQESSLLSLLKSMLVFNMIVVGGDTWTSAFGAAAVTYEEPFGTVIDGSVDSPYFASDCALKKDELVHPMFLDKALGLGKRVVEVTTKLKRTQ